MKKDPLSDYLINRSGLVELIIVAIIIGLSVSLAISSLTLFSWFNPLIGLCAGLIICCVALGILFWRTFSRINNKEKNLEGFIVHDLSENKLNEVPGYDFPTKMSQYIDSSFAENPALESNWNRESLYDVNMYPRNRYSNYSYHLICQGVEYYLLKKVSDCLNRYFYPNVGKQDNFVKTYKRHEIPDILLSNKFLELFSKPMEEREAFIESSDMDESIIVASTPSGARYERFQFTLPKNSSLKRVNDHSIKIETPRFDLLIDVVFPGSMTTFSDEFREYYLGEEYNGCPLVIFLNLHVHFKIRSFISIKGWQYYKWVDLLLDDIEKDFSREAFFNRINWNTINTLLYCIKQKEKEEVIKH